VTVAASVPSQTETNPPGGQTTASDGQTTAPGDAAPSGQTTAPGDATPGGQTTAPSDAAPDTGTPRDDAAWSNPFTDVPPQSWYFGPVKYVHSKNLMQGVSANQFQPQTPVSRAMFVTVLHRYEGEPPVSAKSAFSDVEEGRWYTSAVVWANANGIVRGYGDSFGTDDNMKREQMAAILYRYFTPEGSSGNREAGSLDKYTDADRVSDWALDAMEWANATGVLTGRSETELAPEGVLTRAETAAVLERVAETVWERS
jgi:hypothetical protein